MSADRVKPGTPGIMGRAASNFTYVTADGTPFGILEGVATIEADTTGGNATLNLPPAKAYAGRSILVTHVAGGSQLDLAASGSDTVQGGASFASSVDGTYLLQPAGTDWKVITSA